MKEKRKDTTNINFFYLVEEKIVLHYQYPKP